MIVTMWPSSTAKPALLISSQNAEGERFAVNGFRQRWPSYSLRFLPLHPATATVHGEFQHGRRNHGPPCTGNIAPLASIPTFPAFSIALLSLDCTALATEPPGVRATSGTQSRHLSRSLPFWRRNTASDNSRVPPRPQFGWPRPN